ncbi:MAG: hypothetical protein C0524_18180 [Rhodobacter sp.]|nr:hypothetical protein [Rhodobacter sp.]
MNGPAFLAGIFLLCSNALPAEPQHCTAANCRQSFQLASVSDAKSRGILLAAPALARCVTLVKLSPDQGARAAAQGFWRAISQSGEGRKGRDRGRQTIISLVAVNLTPG